MAASKNVVNVSDVITPSVIDLSKLAEDRMYKGTIQIFFDFIPTGGTIKIEGMVENGVYQTLNGLDALQANALYPIKIEGFFDFLRITPNNISGESSSYTVIAIIGS